MLHHISPKVLRKKLWGFLVQDFYRPDAIPDSQPSVKAWKQYDKALNWGNSDHRSKPARVRLYQAAFVGAEQRGNTTGHAARLVGNVRNFIAVRHSGLTYSRFHSPTVTGPLAGRREAHPVRKKLDVGLLVAMI